MGEAEQIPSNRKTNLGKTFTSFTPTHHEAESNPDLKLVLDMIDKVESRSNKNSELLKMLEKTVFDIKKESGVASGQSEQPFIKLNEQISQIKQDHNKHETKFIIVSDKISCA